MKCDFPQTFDKMTAKLGFPEKKFRVERENAFKVLNHVSSVSLAFTSAR